MTTRDNVGKTVALVIRKAPTPDAIARHYGVSITMPTSCWIGEVDGEVAGAGGLAWGMGRCWMFFQTDPAKGTYPRVVMRMANKLLRHAESLGETAVYVTRDAQYATSAKLLRILGFRPTGETLEGLEVYVNERS